MRSIYFRTMPELTRILVSKAGQRTIRLHHADFPRLVAFKRDGSPLNWGLTAAEGRGITCIDRLFNIPLSVALRRAQTMAEEEALAAATAAPPIEQPAAPADEHGEEGTTPAAAPPEARAAFPTADEIIEAVRHEHEAFYPALRRYFEDLIAERDARLREMISGTIERTIREIIG